MYVYCRFRGNDHFFPMTRRSGALPSLPRLLFLLLLRLQLNFSVGIAAGDDQAQDTSPSDSTCQLYMAQSTIPNAGIGVFTAVVRARHTRLRFVSFFAKRFNISSSLGVLFPTASEQGRTRWLSRYSNPSDRSRLAQ